MREKNMATQMSVEKGGGDAPGTRAEIALQAW